MWTQTFSKEYTNISREAVWQAWSDVNNWPKWDQDLEYCDMQHDFSQGNAFILKPKGGPKVRLYLSEVLPHIKFTDYCKFFGAVMYDAHTLQETPNGIRVINTITVKGPLSFLWVRLVAKNVAKSVPMQTDHLVEYARTQHG